MGAEKTIMTAVKYGVIAMIIGAVALMLFPITVIAVPVIALLFATGALTGILGKKVDKA